MVNLSKREFVNELGKQYKWSSLQNTPSKN